MIISGLAFPINVYHNKTRKLKNILVKLQNVVGIWGSTGVTGLASGEKLYIQVSVMTLENESFLTAFIVPQKGKWLQ